MFAGSRVFCRVCGVKLCNSGAQGRLLCHQTSRLLLTPPLNVCECKHDLYRQRSCLERHFCLPVPHRRRRRRRRGACCLHGTRSHLADQPCSNKQLVIIDCGEKIHPPPSKMTPKPLRPQFSSVLPSGGVPAISAASPERTLLI